MFECMGKGGSSPLTCQCLNDPKVLSKLLGDGDDDFDEYLLAIQAGNSLTTHTLTDGG